jgi:hypothetical protein
MGYLGSTENVQTIFELLPCSVEHVRWNSRDRIPDTGLQVMLCLVNVEAKVLDRLCRSILLEISGLGTLVPADPNEVEHYLLAE